MSVEPSDEAMLAATEGRIEELEAALRGIRGVVLGPRKNGKKLNTINEIAGEALYGDFRGALAKAYKKGWAMK